MLPDRIVHAHLSLKAGPHVEPPNTVVIPADRKTFVITVQWVMEAKETFVIAAPDVDVSRLWCVLDEKLKNVQSGSDSRGRHSKKTDPNVARTIQGGGAPNPREMAVELTSARYKNGHTYTLVAKRFGVAAAAEFVAIMHPKKKAAPKKKAKKKAAAKKSPVKKASAKKNPAPGKAVAKKKAPARKAATKKK